MSKKDIVRKLPKGVLNYVIFISRFLRSPRFAFTKIGFFRYNWYNFKEFVLGEKNFIIDYNGWKFHNFGREILNEENEKTYSSIKNCNNVLDLGGYNGDTALFLSENNNKVYVFEPEEKKFEYIKKNIELNNKEKEIIPYNFAVVANNKKNMEIKKSSDYDVGSSAYEKNNSNFTTEKVKCMHIKNVLKITNFDGMKCDIEGGEWEIIGWMINNKKFKQFKKIVFELHFSKHNQEWNNKFRKFLEFMNEKNMNYQFFSSYGKEKVRNEKDEIKKILEEKYNEENYSVMIYIENSTFPSQNKNQS